MSILIVSLILGSALLHATWNALLRSGADRLGSITLMSMVSGVVALPLCLLFPGLPVDVWSYVLLSAAIQIGYCILLSRAYDLGDLSQVYPLARGTAPLLVTIGAAISAGEWPTEIELIGLTLVCGGIFALGFGQGRINRRGLVTAMAAGVCIAGYMVTDGLGVRLSPNSLSYIAWMMLAQSIPMPFLYRIMRGRWPPMNVDSETAKALGGGVLSMVGYGVVIWAMSLAAMSQVSALRESSILFATLIGVVFLRESITWFRVSSALAIMTGVIFIAI